MEHGIDRRSKAQASVHKAAQQKESTKKVRLHDAIRLLKKAQVLDPTLHFRLNHTPASLSS
jgi:hypothetical protein